MCGRRGVNRDESTETSVSVRMIWSVSGSFSSLSSGFWAWVWKDGTTAKLGEVWRTSLTELGRMGLSEIESDYNVWDWSLMSFWKFWDF